MGTIGGFTKTRNYPKRRRAIGRYRSPYQSGGTLFTPPPIIPFFPGRAPPWLNPYQVGAGRIKGRRKRKRRTRR